MLGKYTACRAGLLVTTIGAAQFAWITPAMAQASSASESRAEATSDDSADIVVTARRREENLLSVPLAVQAVGGAELTERKVIQLQDLAMYTPGFRQTNGISGVQRFIRGAGSGSSPAFDQAVGSFTDEVNTSRSQFSRLPLFDLERVEVLRGPQVILFGNSTTGGVISTISKKPGFTFEGDATASYEFYNHEAIIQGGITLPVSDTFAVRVAGLHQALSKGWVKAYNGTPNVIDDPRNKVWAGRVTAVFKPVDDLRITAKYEKSSTKLDGSTTETIFNPLNNPLITDATFDRRRSYGTPAPFGLFSNAGVPNDFAHFDAELIQGNIAYDIGDFQLTSNTAWVNFQFRNSYEGDMTPLAIHNVYQTQNYHQFSQEIKLDGKLGNIADVQAGFYYQLFNDQMGYYNDANRQLLGSAIPPISRQFQFSQRTRTLSGFASIAFHVTSQLNVEFGARYIDTSRSSDQLLTPATIGTFIPDSSDAARAAFVSNFGGAPHNFVDVRSADSHFMPQAVIQYSIDNDVMVYAKYVRGAKAGGFDWQYGGATAAAALFRPEKAASYEAGLKGKFFDRALTASLVVFRTDITDLQVNQFNGVTFLVGNAAVSRNQGVEAELTWHPAPGLTISNAVSFLDAKYRDFEGGGCTYDQRAATPAGTTCRQNLTGTTTPFSSRWQNNLGIAYSGTIGDFTIKPRLDVSYRSSYNATTVNDPIGQQKGYALVDARVALSRTDADWSVAIYGKNLTNKLYQVFTSDQPYLAGTRLSTSDRGRQIGLEVSTRF